MFLNTIWKNELQLRLVIIVENLYNNQKAIKATLKMSDIFSMFFVYYFVVIGTLLLEIITLVGFLLVM